GGWGGGARVGGYGRGGGRGPRAFGIHRAIADAETPAGRADLAKHRRKRDGHPERLLAVVGALQRPARVDERTARGHAPGEQPQAPRPGTRGASRPPRALRDTRGFG